MAEEKASSISKFFALNSKPTKETFPELPDYVVWARCILAILYGIWLGFSNIERSAVTNFAFGLNFVTFLPVVYCSTYLGADHEAYDNKLLFAGVFNATALLVLIWTYQYTMEHEQDEKIFASALVSTVKGAVGTADILDGFVDGDMAIPPIVEESEF